MDISWFLSFDTLALAVWNVLCIGITLVALGVFVRGLIGGRGLRWRDLCLIPNLVVGGAAVPIFVVVWLVAEWVSTDRAEAPVVEGDPWVPGSGV
jgi:hypothetical protein